MDRHHAPGGRLRRIVPAVGSAVLVALTVVSCTSDAPDRPSTATVTRGVVSTGVSATGSMSAISQQYVGFPNGGQLTNVFVKVGDKVEPGQVLATVDDFALRQKLAQQEGQLKSQQAAVDRLVNSPVADGAQDSLAEAKDILEATRRQTDAVLEADEVAIDNAERQLAVDKDAKEQAEETLEDSEDACGDDNPYEDAGSAGGGNTGGGSSDSGSSEDGNTGGRSTDSNDGSDNDGGNGSGDDEGSDSEDDGDSDSDEAAGEDGTGSLIGSPISYRTSSSRTSQANPACSAIPSNEAALTAAKQQVAASQGALDSAIKARDVDKANGELAIENAEKALVNARNTADSAESDQPFDIAEQQGALASTQAAVAAAKRDVENATLRAPVAGTVSAVNGVVGEYLAPSSGTSALAPGSTAAIPGAGGSPPAAAAGAGAGGAANPARPGGTQFLMLDNIDAFQVVVPFSEADAAAIAPNQKVNIAVDALPDLTLTGSVLSVAPTGTDISGVISYYATVVVDGADPRLKDGQTVRATVVTQEVDDVLTIPSAAVRHENGKPTVTVLGEEGEELSIPFQPGAVGQDRTQVVSGLREGQQVVLPVAR